MTQNERDCEPSGVLGKINIEKTDIMLSTLTWENLQFTTLEKM